MWGSPWAGFVPPPPLFGCSFSAFLAAGGGGLWVWFSALSCRGSVVVAVACSGLGPLGPRSPSPLRLGFFFLAVSVSVWPAGCHFPGGGVYKKPFERCGYNYCECPNL